MQICKYANEKSHLGTVNYREHQDKTRQLIAKRRQMYTHTQTHTYIMKANEKMKHMCIEVKHISVVTTW